MRMAPLAAVATPLPATLSLSRAERALAAFLRDDVVAAFANATTETQREDVYLELNQVLRLDDTLGSVRVLQHFLPTLLQQLHTDLTQHVTARDLLHLALRTLSYFMHHAALAAAFPDAEVERFLSDIASLLAATPDEGTYKACLWCLTMQDFDLTRLDFLPRIVEALVLAIINPFSSRPIAIQAIKGLHRLAGKYKPLMIAHGATLRIWFRPVVSRLASSDTTTRHHVVLALQEAAAYSLTHHLPSDVEHEAAAALVEYALPAMQAHVTQERNHEALTVWKIIMILMRRKLATDVVLLNDLLSVAEPLMRHADASVRLQSIDVWRHVVGVFRVNSEWVFDKHVVLLLVRPIISCLESETMFNVLHAAISTWRVVVSAAVEDFNAFCEAQGRSVDAIQQSAKKIKWKKWLEELVRKVVATAIDQERSQATGETGHPSHAAVHDEIRSILREMFTTAVITTADSELTANSMHPGSSIGSSTTAASSHPEPQSRDELQSGLDISEQDEQLLDAEVLQHSASASLSLGEATHSVVSPCPPLSSHLLALAIALPEVLKTVERLGAVSDNSAREQRYQQLGLSIWDGFCARLAKPANNEPVDLATEKMRLRLVRFCLDFTFGLSSSSSAPSSSLDSQASTLAPSLPTDSVMTAADLINGSKQQVHSVHALRWQLRLLQQVVSLTSSVDELVGLFLHPKSKIGQHLLNRVDRIVDVSDVYKEWLAQWDQAAVREPSSEKRIDFSAKSSTILCVMVYLLLSLALVLDGQDARSGPTANELLWEVVGIYSDVIEAIHKCIDAKSHSSEIVIRFCHLVLKSPTAAKAVLDREAPNASAADAQAGRLLKACDQITSRSEDTQDNAEMLLQLQRSPVKTMSPPRAPNASSSSVTTETLSGKLDEPNSAVSTGSDAVTSPCMLQAHRNSTAANRASATVAPSTPPLAPTAQNTAANTFSTAPLAPQTPVRLKKSSLKAASTPSKTGDSTPARKAVSSGESMQSGIVFPELANCTDPIGQVYGLLPFSFRQIAPFYKIETVGNLAGMTEEQVKKIGIKDGATTVRKALTEYQARRARSKLPTGINSPFRQRLQSPPTKSPATLASPSPRRILKRPTDSPNRLPLTPLPFESPQQRKRARRSLHELSSEADTSSEVPSNSTPSEQRVKFQLEGEDGERRITHPGSDSQDAIEVKEEKENPLEKLESFFLKMDQHLRRSLHYAEKIAEEEASIHSSSASLGDETSKLAFITSATERSLGFVASINAQLMASFERRQNRAEQASEGPEPDPPNIL